MKCAHPGCDRQAVTSFSDLCTVHQHRDTPEQRPPRPDPAPPSLEVDPSYSFELREVEFFLGQLARFEVGPIGDAEISDVVLLLPRALEPRRFLPGRLVRAVLEQRQLLHRAAVHVYLLADQDVGGPHIDEDLVDVLRQLHARGCVGAEGRSLAELADEYVAKHSPLDDDDDRDLGEVEPEVLVDMLGLVMARPPRLEVIASWTAEQRELVEDWAAAAHLNASDHGDVEVPPRPDFLEDGLLDQHLADVPDDGGEVPRG